MNKEKLIYSPHQHCEARDRSPRGFREWIDFFQKNKPQTNALSAGLMLMVVGGSQIGWGIFNNHIEVQPWASGYEDTGTIFWTIVSFFIAVIPGLTFGSLIVDRFSKLKIYSFASILSMTSSIILIYGASTHELTISRVFGGFSHGVAYLTVLIHASEVAIPKLRGMIVASIHFCLIIGVYVTSTCLMPVYSTRNYEVDPTQTIGYNGLICVISGLLLALIFNRESPVYLIKRNKENEALETIIRLRSESHETITIRHDFNEFRIMIAEDKESSLNLLKYWRATLTVLLFKLIFVASFNMTINNYFLDLVKFKFYDANNDYSGMYLMTARWIIMIITMFLIDTRRISLFLSTSLKCGLILIFLGYFSTSEESFSSVLIAIIFQLFAGVAVGFMADIYSVDSVNTKIKPFFIAFTTSVEFLLQILFIVNFLYIKINISILITVFGIIMLLGILTKPLFHLIPDTSQLSLRLARNVFQY